jgi:glycosyltransferase involved in cell wall biosynthesis
VTGNSPTVSIVIPVYNEEAILHAALVDLRERLGDASWSYEIILAENGSTDETIRIATEMMRKYSDLRLVSVDEPNYGLALKRGIESARGEFVICDEIDLCDTEFHQRAVALLIAGQADVVIGSKLMGGAEDRRPTLRHAASLFYTGLLRVLLGFEGTDTHGLKALRRSAILDVLSACQVDRDVFASELVIRAYRARLNIVELPVRVIEKRPPGVNLLKRVPNVIKSLAKLYWSIRVRR